MSDLAKFSRFRITEENLHYLIVHGKSYAFFLPLSTAANERRDIIST